MMLGCNLKLVVRVLLFTITSKSTCKSMHSIRLCGLGQSRYIAIVLGIVAVGWSKLANIIIFSHMTWQHSVN